MGKDHEVHAIHGDLRHGKREKVIRDFRKDKYRILVATDIAARGLDIPQIEHVINYDLPQCAEDYVHRIGRTGRAGNSGEAVCFVTPSDQSKWSEIDRLMHPKKVSEKREERKKLFEGRSPRVKKEKVQQDRAYRKNKLKATFKKKGTLKKSRRQGVSPANKPGKVASNKVAKAMAA